jgi:WD40 repeat protein
MDCILHPAAAPFSRQHCGSPFRELLRILLILGLPLGVAGCQPPPPAPMQVAWFEKEYHLDSYGYGLVFSPDGKQIAAGRWDGGNRQIVICGTKECILQKKMDPLPVPVSCFAWAPSQPLLAVGGNESSPKDKLIPLLFLVDPKTGKQVRSFVGHEKRVKHVAFAPDGKTLLSVSDDGTARLWDVGTGKERLVLRDLGDKVGSLAWNAEGNRLASFSNSPKVRIWDAVKGTLLLELQGPKVKAVGAVAFSPTRPLLATGVHVHDGYAVDLWDLTDETKPTHAARLERPYTLVDQLAFHKNGRYLAVGDEHGFVHLWDVENKKLFQSIYHNGQIEDIVFSPDGERLAVVILRDSGVLTLWKLRPPGSPPVCPHFGPTSRAPRY